MFQIPGKNALGDLQMKMTGIDLSIGEYGIEHINKGTIEDLLG